jgi:dTMP kinase
VTGGFVVVDGPSGVGKSTVVPLLAQRLENAGQPALPTREPSTGPIGALARAGTHDYHGISLACLVAADRYHHLATIIRPAVSAGTIVICDRYVATSLVLQETDGVAAETVWEINAQADPPDLTLILLGNPVRLRQRAELRGTYSRFHQSITNEVDRYRDVAERLAAAGHRTIVHDIGDRSAEQVADDLLSLIQQHLTAAD